MSAAPDMTSRRVTRDSHAYCQGLARILDEADHVRSNPRDVQDVWATEEWARSRAREIIQIMAAGVTGLQASTGRVGASR